MILPISRFSYGTRAARALLHDPVEGRERICERVAEWREGRVPQADHIADSHWERKLHDFLHVSWPCPEVETFSRLWAEIVRSLEDQGLAVGRGTFGGWDDADPALARAAWCITTHARPRIVVETGVARGITSRVILEGLERDGGGGHLLSVDLPPLIELGVHEQIAAAVPRDRRAHWTLVRGSSRRALPGVLEQVLEVDLFLHDSTHTARNLHFELDHVWPVLNEGGFILADDIDRNDAFQSFTGSRHGQRSLVGLADDGRALIGIIQKKSE